MGHLVGKDIYKKLGKKIDGLSLRVPYTPAFAKLLKELYNEDEAELVAKLPYRPSTIGRISRTTGISPERLKPMLDRLCDNGLVFDLWNEKRKQYMYMSVPFVIGIYEFTLMRTGDPDKSRHWAELLHAYMDEDDMYRANINQGHMISVMRTIPHDDPLLLNNYVEIYDYQKARTIVENNKVFAIGLCSCRHEAMHMNLKKCKTPLETCCTFGPSAEYLIRHKLAKPVGKNEMLESLARAQESCLVLNGDNVKRRVEYICQCCSCCCHLIQGINRHNARPLLVGSGLKPVINTDTCKACGKCVKACPVHALEMKKDDNGKVSFTVDTDLCIGCTVCSRTCKFKAISMDKSEKKVFYPEDGLQKYILSCLERGTLQNLIFDDPQNTTQEFMRIFFGAFLRLKPVKRALLSDMLRSRFLKMIMG
jgi:NAD-dependent dihydropyrimidine dehydrogenase PreA subunit